MAAHRVLSVTVASGRVGYVFLEGTQLQDWAVTTSVSGKSTDLVAFVEGLIDTLNPDILVTEKCDKGCKKGRRTKRLIAAIAELGSHAYVLDISIPRPRRYPSKYEEAESLVSRHPDLIGYLPKHKRRIFDFEPREMIIFEALSLAEQALLGPEDTQSGQTT